METKNEDGGPAFPRLRRLDTPSSGQIEAVYSADGMSQRIWLAGLAMQGMLSNPDIFRQIREEANQKDEFPSDTTARLALQYADSMLTAGS